MLLSRCCCCCSLKYGYFAYTLLSMAARLMACVSLYHASQSHFSSRDSTLYLNTRNNSVLQIWIAFIMNIYSGWIITSAVSLFFTMKGIVQKRSILIYPYIVVLVIELSGLIISVTFLAIVSTTYYLIILPFAALILGYELWCLISLYKQIKHNERIRYIPDTVPLKAV